MNESNKERLQSLVISVLQWQVKEKGDTSEATALKRIMKQLEYDFVNVQDVILLTSINKFMDEEYYKDKPIIYFKAIVMNKQEDYTKNRKKEQRKLGGIPGKIVG